VREAVVQGVEHEGGLAEPAEAPDDGDGGAGDEGSEALGLLGAADEERRRVGEAIAEGNGHGSIYTALQRIA
jgi:hypothetical protein